MMVYVNKLLSKTNGKNYFWKIMISMRSGKKQ